MGQSSRQPGATPADSTHEPLRLGCVYEQAIGHVTFAANLGNRMRDWPDVAPEWHALPYRTESRWPPRRLNWALRCGLMARQALRGKVYDALLFHTHLPALLCADHLDRTPTLLSMDATPAQNARLGIYVGGSQGQALLRKLTSRWTGRVLAKAYRIIAWSNWVRTSLVDEYGIDPIRIEVLPPGIDVAVWDAAARERPRHARAAASRPARILFVGGDLRAKGGELLTECFRRSWRGRAELHLVTRTPLSAEEGLFVHHGMSPNSPELVRLFRDADIFALPTLGDTFGLAILEAMASGLPVVASQTGAIPELVVEGETGFLVPVDDTSRLRAAVSALMDDPALRKRMGEAGRERARERFDIARNGRRLVDLAHQAKGRHR